VLGAKDFIVVKMGFGFLLSVFEIVRRIARFAIPGFSQSSGNSFLLSTTQSPKAKDQKPNRQIKC
jgi:hypothetical protein